MKDTEKAKIVASHAAGRSFVETLKSIPGLATFVGWVEGTKEGADKVEQIQRTGVRRALNRANHEDTRFLVDQRMSEGVEDIKDHVSRELQAPALSQIADFQRLTTDAKRKLTEEEFGGARALLDLARERYWSKADEEQKIDFICEYANSYLRANEFDRATKYFLAELPSLPATRRSRHALCLAYYLNGAIEAAHELAKALIADYPDSDKAAALYIQTAPSGTAISDLLTVVPEVAKASDELLLTIGARFLGDGNLEAAAGYFEKAAAKREGKSSTSTLLLTRTRLQIILLRSGNLPELPPDDEEKKALVALATALLSLLPSANGKPDAFRGELHFTLSMIYALLRNDEEEARHFGSAMHLLPSESSDLRRLQRYLRLGMTRKAVELVRAMPEERRPDVLFLQVEALLAEESGEHGELLHETALRYFEAETDLRRQFYVLFKLSQVDRQFTCEQIEEHLVKYKRDEPLLWEYLSLLFFKLTRETPEMQILDRIRRSDHSGFSDDEFQIALAIIDRKAAPQLYTHIATMALANAKSLGRQASFCRLAYRSGLYQPILRKAESLKVQGIYSPVLFAHEIHILSIYAPKAALERATTLYAEHPECIEWKLHVLLLGMRLKDHSITIASRDELPSPDEVNAETGHLCVQLLRYYGFSKEAVEYAFALHENFSHDLHAHLAVLQAMGPVGPFNIRWGRAFEPIVYEHVESGSAVRIRKDITDDVVTVYLVSVQNPRLPGTVSEGTALANALTGKSVGDRITEGSMEGVIVEILDSRVARYQSIMQDFEDRFPDSGALRKFEVSTSDETGKSDFSQIHSLMKKLYRQQELARSIYRDGNIPIQCFANFLGRGIEECWYDILADDSLPAYVRYDYANRPELSSLTSKAIVVDITALVTLLHLDKMDLLQATQLHVRASQNTVIRFEEFLDYLEKLIDSEMTLEATAGGFRPVINNCPDDIRATQRQRIQRARSVLHDLPAFVPNELIEIDSGLRDEMQSALSDVSLEALFHASQNDMVLWSDEGFHDLIPFRLSRVWTGEILDSLLSRDSCYLKLKADLIGARCRLVPTNAAVILHCGERSEYRPHVRPFAQALDTFSDKEISIEAVKRVAYAFLGNLYMTLPADYRREQITNRVIAGLVDISGGMFFSHEIIGEMRRRLAKNPMGLHDFLSILKAWQIAQSRPKSGVVSYLG